MNHLLFQVEDRPPLLMTVLLAAQHMLAALGGIIAVPLVVGAALKLPADQIITLINAALLGSGIVTIIQCKGVGPVGIRLPGTRPRLHSDRDRTADRMERRQRLRHARRSQRRIPGRRAASHPDADLGVIAPVENPAELRTGSTDLRQDSDSATCPLRPSAGSRTGDRHGIGLMNPHHPRQQSLDHRSESSRVPKGACG